MPAPLGHVRLSTLLRVSVNCCHSSHLSTPLHHAEVCANLRSGKVLFNVVTLRTRLRRYILPADVSANLFPDEVLFNVVTLRTCLRRYIVPKSVQICAPTKSIDGGFAAIRTCLRRYTI